MIFTISLLIFRGRNVYAAAAVAPAGAGVSGNTVDPEAGLSSDPEVVENDQNIQDSSEDSGDVGQLIHLCELLVDGLGLGINCMIRLLMVIAMLLAVIAGTLIITAVFDHWIR